MRNCREQSARVKVFHETVYGLLPAKRPDPCETLDLLSYYIDTTFIGSVELGEMVLHQLD
jgi:hypothetical protein